ncbi:Rpn family recombination-promoting nuclease/putative transposase [Bacillus sp. SD088]|nr:Rpn family recombination-promoting nuclease/putative transposase [Bacillus sp. SD088]
MDLKVDYAFKQLFGNDRNKVITIKFLNAILQKTNRNQIVDITFQNTESSREYKDDKESRLDLLAVTNADEWINIEIQFTNKFDMIKRSIYYWSDVYKTPLMKSMNYKQLRPVIAINILNFNLFSETERFHTSYHLYEDEDRFQLTDVLEFHFLEMGKLLKDWKDDKLDPWNDILARWLLMLGVVDHRNGKQYDDIFAELEEISMEDESLRTAFEDWEKLSLNQEQYIAYTSRMKRIIDDESFRQDMESMAEEIELGKKEVEQRRKDLERGRNEFEQNKRELEQDKKRVVQEKSDLAKIKKEFTQKAEEVARKEKEAKQKIEAVARKLLKNNLEIDLIVESTGLTKDHIMELKKEL